MLTAAVTDAAVQPARAPTADPVVFYGLFGLLLFGPLAFGAVEPWSIFVLEAGAGLLLLLWTVRQATSGELSVTGIVYDVQTGRTEVIERNSPLRQASQPNVDP